MLTTEFVRTEDDLRLQGMHFSPSEKETAVVFVHGMSGNYIENFYGHVLGEELCQNGFGFLFGHNRGFGHINDLCTSETDQFNGFKTKRFGVVYERFEDCVLDIDAWIEKAFELGYAKVVLMGHSLGCNKAVHYFFKKQPKNISGLVLMSPPDMVANGKENGKSQICDKLLLEAKQNLEKGEPRKILSEQLWDWYSLSSQTFLDLFSDFGPADNLPFLRNPEKFVELESVDVPILSIMGEFDDIVVRSVEEDQQLLKSKAINVEDFSTVTIVGANHSYENREKELADVVVGWLNEKLER